MISKRIYRSQYEAIPYKLHYLSKPLSNNPNQVINIIRRWYSHSKELFTYKGGKLLTNIFPSITGEFQKELISILKSEDLEDIDFVLSILLNYTGETSIHTLCRELILTIPEDDEIRLREVRHILMNTGVVSGEFGFVDAYKRKKDEITPWLEDQDKRVSDFAKKYIGILDKHIASEHRRAEQDKEMRKREYRGNED